MTVGAGLIRDSDIAVVGMACRFPGASNTDAFWQNLRSGVESVEFLNEEELIAKGLPPAKVRDPAYVKARASMADVEMFDARFFGFSPRDAAIVDPQHRQFLECAYECLENAGHTPRRFSGSIGVFAGSGCNLYLIHHLFSHPEMIDEIGFFQVKHTGNDKDYLATRLSYCLNLTGPSVNVQTACSTSLVAIHSACQSLLGAECDLALAGGVTIDVTLTHGYRYSEGEVLSPDGHCHAFDHRARGTIFGNGVGVVALRRLNDAIRDGNTIHAVIKGSAINNDGSSKVGYLAPSIEGQYQAVLQALGVADVPVESISYVETHGTGTIVGDPIEVRALTQAFQTQTELKQFCGLGSVKTNVGHLDTAAGVASFIKVVESLKHGELPPSLNYEKPNPSIDFAQSPFYVNDRLRSWPRGDHPRRAGVNSLAVGGTNAHVIVEEAPVQEPSGPYRPWQLVVVSARSEAARNQSAQSLVGHLRATPDANLADVAYTLQVGRTEFDYRSMLVAQDAAEAADLLSRADGKGVVAARVPDAACEVVFMFTGQGAQHAGMGAELYRTEPTFRATVDQCSDVLKEKLGFDLSELLYGTGLSREEADARLRQTAVTQPALFVVEYSLARLWMEWGVKPRAFIGHSIGEYVAACLAGVISLEDALSLVAARGRLMQSTPAGAMLAIKTGEQEVLPLLDRALSVAAVNSPSSCVVSGLSAGIDALEKRLRTQDIQCTRLHTSHAFHSAMMDEILDPFERQFAEVRLSAPKIPFVSNLTGRWISPDEATSPRYWVRHLRETVRFADGLTALLSQADRVLLEVGPGTTLTTLARQHPLRDAARAIVASLPAATENTSDGRVAVSTCGRLWLSGVEVDWDGFHRHERRRRIPLPTYPFEHQYHWIDAIRREPVEPPVSIADAGRQRSDSWFWTPVWKKTPPVDASRDLDTSNWVVFGDDDSLTTNVLAQLREIQFDGGGNARLELCEAGDFNSLAVRRVSRTEPGPGEVELEVRTAGLNFRDVLIALGAYPDAESAVMGSECAGVITRVGKGVSDFKPGDEIVAIAPGFQRFVTVHSNLVARKPKAISFEEAATIPVSFMTAHYALCEVGKLTRGERVLIQAASGGVGLAAVAIAQSLGAEVFATAGSAEKRTFLQSLGVRHVFDSRSTDFADKLLAATGGEGVDVVLNSLAGEFIVRGLEVLRPLGRFLEIGKSDIYGNSQLALLPFRKNISFCSIDLEIVREQRPDFYRNRLRELVDRFAEGTFRPLPLRVFPLRKAGQAFQYMAKAKHIGKIVLSLESPLSSITRVATGRGFKRISDSLFEIDPTSAEDYKALFGKLATSGREPDRLVYLWSSGLARNSGLNRTVLADAENRYFDGLLSWAQAFADSGISTPVKLAVVTRGAHRVLETRAGNPLAALTLGPVNVIPRELENVATLAIDFAAGAERDGNAEAATITAELRNDDQTRVIAYRDGDRFVRTFEQTRLEDRQPTPLREKGVYLITGGFGGIGLVFARYLAHAHKARLVLVGRTPIPLREQWDQTLRQGTDERVSSAIRATTELESQGAEIMAASADVAEPAQMQSVISAARSRFGAIHGVIHAAGHIEDAPLQMKTKESAARVLRSKVAGTLNLHQQLSNAPLDFFAVFSSVSAINSPAGQIDYAAANSFLDSFAHVDSGVKVVAIDWAAWRDVGMAVRALEKQASKRLTSNLSESRQLHPLFESCSSNGDSKVFWTVPLGTKHWLLDEHRVADGSALLPGTGYLELIRGALAQEVDNGELDVRDVRFLAPFVVGQGDDRRLKIAMHKEAAAWDLVVTSTSNGKHDDGAAEDVEHVRASARRASKSEPGAVSLQEIQARCGTSAPPHWDGGPSLTFGPRWDNLKELRLGSNEAFARLQLPEPFEKEVSDYKLHPALVDIAVACGFPLAPGFTPEADSYAPLGCERLVTRGPLSSRTYAHVRRTPAKNKTGHLLTLDIRMIDESGTIVAEIDGFTLKKLSPEQIRGNGSSASGKQSPDRSPSGNSLERAVHSGIGSSQGIEAFLAILKDGRYSQIAVSPVSLTDQAEDRRDPVSSAHEPQAVPSLPGAPAAVGTREDDVERGVLEVLKKALGAQNLSADDNFFEMGGDSLSAMRVVTQLKNRFSTTLPIGTLFENPTAATLTAFMKEQVEKSR